MGVGRTAENRAYVEARFRVALVAKNGAAQSAGQLR
jgi:hypothetical protein